MVTAVAVRWVRAKRERWGRTIFLSSDGPAGEHRIPEQSFGPEMEDCRVVHVPQAERFGDPPGRLLGHLLEQERVGLTQRWVGGEQRDRAVHVQREFYVERNHPQRRVGSPLAGTTLGRRAGVSRSFRGGIVAPGVTSGKDHEGQEERGSSHVPSGIRHGHRWVRSPDQPSRNRRISPPAHRLIGRCEIGEVGVDDLPPAIALLQH